MENLLLWPWFAMHISTWVDLGRLGLQNSDNQLIREFLCVITHCGARRSKPCIHLEDRQMPTNRCISLFCLSCLHKYNLYKVRCGIFGLFVYCMYSSYIRTGKKDEIKGRGSQSRHISIADDGQKHVETCIFNLTVCSRTCMRETIFRPS